MEKENKLYSPDRTAQNGKTDVRSRFCKYKPQIQRAKSYNSEDRLEQIFSQLCYRSILLDKSFKDGSNSAIERLSTFQSQLDFSQQEINVDVNNVIIAEEQKGTNIVSPLQPDKNLTKPVYIQHFNRLNSITPNHNHPKFNLKQQMISLNLLIKEGLKAIHHVFGCALRIGNKSAKINVFNSTDSKKFTLNYFLNSGWQKLKPQPCILQIKPNEPFKPTLDFNQILSQLDLLLSKTSRYELAGSLTQQIDLNLYLKIRDHLFEVEQRLLQCSNSLYDLWNSNQYPDFYYVYLKIIKTPYLVSQEEKQLMIKQFRQHWQINQPVTCSDIGRQVWNKLHEQRHSTQQI